MVPEGVIVLGVCLVLENLRGKTISTKLSRRYCALPLPLYQCHKNVASVTRSVPEKSNLITTMVPGY
eukprot:944980-Rhodomonas_salina.3